MLPVSAGSISCLMVSIQNGALGDWHLVLQSQHKRACHHVRRSGF